jgi:murein DD-endopeptidase MepM/ murein hydrolase activator NlpD
MMKKKYIPVIVTIGVLWCISTLGFAIAANIDTKTVASEKPKADIRADIAKKLEEYSRIQNALGEIAKDDAVDFNEEWFSTKDAAERAANLWNNIETVISDIEKIQNQRKENNENYMATMKQIRRVIIDIKTTKKTITDSARKINIYTQRMIETKSHLQETITYINNTRETLSKLLPALFVIQNAYTNQAWSVDDLKLILDSQDWLSSTLTFDDALQWLSAKLDTILWDLIQAQKKYTQIVKDIHETRKELKKTVLTYRQKIDILEEQRAYLLDFLSLYKGNKIKLDTKITNLFETREQLKQRVAIIIDKINKDQQTWSFLSTEAYQAFLEKKDDREKRPNMISWPLVGIDAIPTFFGDKITVWDKEEVFEWIQIQAEQWQEIYAPADWLVYYMQDQDSMWINRIAILHKNWYISVFTNLQKVLVKQNDVIGRGQLIGLVWGQPWTRWAWWFSNGPMVSMQLYKNGNAVDPLQIMDLSVINNPTLLPETYQVKYDVDVRTRSAVIDFSEVKFMQGNSVRERRLNFLDKVAAWPYADIVLWESAAEGTNVDVDLWICIWYAETSMGRNFASANNIGNVGNNDRWDRVDKDSPLEWARSIYNTLNNRYLWHYQTIYELSGYGNKDWAIYASSEYNWQKNVSRCLSTIKWYIVPEDFPFRTYGELVE